jgi:hypothetical protein
MTDLERLANFPGKDRDEKRLPKAAEKGQQHSGGEPAGVFTEEGEDCHKPLSPEISGEGSEF